MVVPLAFGWRHLLFANWPVDADLLDAHLPNALSVQEYDGAGWLSVVPFVNVETRPRGLPARLGVRLPELNLRTYVTCDGEPGVYFFSLDAHGLSAVLGARLLHRLPYYYARMRCRWDGRRRRMEFTSRRLHPGDRPVRFEASYGPADEPFTADPGSRAEFLTERRRLYTQAADGTVRYTDVEHEPWTLRPAEVSIAENTLFEANAFDHPETDPVFYYSPGVDVVTTRSKRWDRTSPRDRRRRP
ncbi:YqjF family protein [Halalkalicoccus salilacus]|uniref:YqjF family protein n=1 Tax=Halalkalicoccus salilacus TaxID=3117459 RepID=UPI00300E970B